jgi:putative transposase
MGRFETRPYATRPEEPKINGRKRHIVDTIGLIVPACACPHADRAVVVHSAAIQDRDGAKLVLGRLAGRFPRLLLTCPP